jgi:amino acid transporter
LFFVFLIAVVNLRGVKESGRAFAIPTYGFIALLYLIFIVAGWKYATGHHLTAESARYTIRPVSKYGGLLTVFLVLRSFASGCTALTGVEAISNGVPAFRKPKSKNAAQTLSIMAALAVTMFIGTTVLALSMHVHASDAPTCGLTLHGRCATEGKTVIAQIGAAAFGSDHAVLFYAFQLFTAAILILAANTAYNGFPVLASILARDGYLPRQLHNRGDRLVFSNGIVALALFAGALIWAFNASVARLVQLYIIGVFVSFTLSQTGMVRHWQRKMQDTVDESERSELRRSQLINASGAALSGLVLVVVLITKFTHGAWIAVAAMVALFAMMVGISKHYRSVADELQVVTDERVLLPARNHAIVLVSKLHLPTLRAVAYAKGTRPYSLEAVTVSVDPQETERLQQLWFECVPDVPLIVLESQYRDLTKPVIDYVRRYRRQSPRDVVTVFIPEYVVGRWWEHLLHNQSALRLKGRLLFEPGVMVTSVPWQMRSTAARPPRLTTVGEQERRAG